MSSLLKSAWKSRLHCLTLDFVSSIIFHFHHYHAQRVMIWTPPSFIVSLPGSVKKAFLNLQALRGFVNSEIWIHTSSYWFHNPPIKLAGKFGEKNYYKLSSYILKVQDSLCLCLSVPNGIMSFSMTPWRHHDDTTKTPWWNRKDTTMKAWRHHKDTMKTPRWCYKDTTMIPQRHHIETMMTTGSNLIFITFLLFQVKLDHGNWGNLTELPTIILTVNNKVKEVSQIWYCIRSQVLVFHKLCLKTVLYFT